MELESTRTRAQTPKKTPAPPITPSRFQSAMQYLGLSPRTPQTTRVRRSARLRHPLGQELEVEIDYRGDVLEGGEYPEFFGEHEIINRKL